MPIHRHFDEKGILHSRCVGAITYNECVEASKGFADWFPPGTFLYELVSYEFGSFYDLTQEQSRQLVDFSRINLQRWPGGAICLVGRTDLIYASAVLFVETLNGSVPQTLHYVETDEEGLRWLSLRQISDKTT